MTLEKFNAYYSKSKMKWKKQLENLKVKCDIALELDKLVDASTTSIKYDPNWTNVELD